MTPRRLLHTAAATAATSIFLFATVGAANPPRHAYENCPTSCLQSKVRKLEKRVARINRRAVKLERDRNGWRRTSLHQWTMTEAITISSIVYGVPISTLTRRMLCESHGYRYAHNKSGATSYWQFLPSTWASTPFAGLSIYSPFAQAMSAGWMMGPAGRSSEWQCR